MTSRAEQAVAVARRWVGTPYRHQAALETAGCDCLGLVRGVWRELYGAEPEAIPAYSRGWDEVDGDEVLWTAAKRVLVEKSLTDIDAGDVLLFRLRSTSVAKHLGIQSQTGGLPRFVHAYSGHGVMESPLSTPWTRRIVARFSFPEESN